MLGNILMLIVAILGFVSTYNPDNILGKFLNYTNGGLIVLWAMVILSEVVR